MPCLQSPTFSHAAMAALSWLKRGRLVSAVSRSTGDLLKALNQPGTFGQTNDQGDELTKQNGSLRRRSKEVICARLQGVIKAGYLYVLTDAGFWFRMWVVLRTGRLETFYESSDNIPMESISLSGGKLTTPRAISSDCPEDVLYPMHIFKEGHPSICLAAENPDELKRWSESIKGILQASSLDIEGLNLEGRGACEFLPSQSQNEAGGENNRCQVLQKLDLLDELLAQRDDVHGKGTERAKELSQKFEGLEQWYERVLMSEQREALRRATHLRQRKISTQLKADTIREQLRSSRKCRPKSSLSFREKPRDDDAPSSFYEGQLRELTDQLNLIHSRLGREEAHSEVASRKLYRKHDHEIHRLHSDLDVLASKSRESTGPHSVRIQISRSQEDCRVDTKKSNHLWIPKNKNAVSMIDLNRTSSRTRLSPLRLLGQLVDAAYVRRRRRNQSDELLPYSRDAEEVQDERDSSGSVKSSKRKSDASSSSSSTSSEKLRTEIDPSALAEIQAFEQLAQLALTVRKASGTSQASK